LGIAHIVMRTRLPIQNAPFIFVGLNIRDNNKPAEKENSRRKEPPKISFSVIANPAPRSPKGPKMAKEANPHPARKTRTANARVGNRRRNNTYKILPIYSKNRDQLGPFKGYISPTPRISKPVVTGINSAFNIVDTKSNVTGTTDTSHTSQPWK